MTPLWYFSTEILALNISQHENKNKNDLPQ